MSQFLPKRNENLEVTLLGDEVMVYDQSNEAAYCLNGVVAQVLLACDGTTSKEELVGKLGGLDHSADLMEMTISELREQGLISSDTEKAGISRRDFISTWGKVAAALPVIAYLAAPDAAHAQSGTTVATTDM